jgi:RNA polymerase sigma factor (TIGR02999 family)
MSSTSQQPQQNESRDPQSASELLPLVYEELRKLARQKMSREKPGQTLQATALVHEAWLRLGGDQQPAWQNQTHFFAAAAEAMRRILIDRARRRGALRRGGRIEKVDLDSIQLAAEADDDQLLAISAALDQLAKHDPAKAELVKLRFFAGLKIPEAARMLDLSPTTAKRHWAYARAWLYRELKSGGAD